MKIKLTENQIKKLKEDMEVDSNGNLITDTEVDFETNHFIFDLEEVTQENEIRGDFTFIPRHFTFPLVILPTESKSYHMEYPDEDIREQFEHYVNEARLGKELNAFMNHILSTLIS